MGLFDFFNKKKASEAATPGVQTPRDQHYGFAHMALRQHAHQRPLDTLAILHSPKGQLFLQHIWGDVTEQCQQQGLPADLPPDGLAVTPCMIADCPAAIITLPPPLATTEAYMVGIIGLRRTGTPLAPGETPRILYYTLEKSSQLRTPGNGTILCQWDGDSHLNYGPGPAPTFEAFAHVLRQRVIAAMLEVPKP